MMKYFFSAEGDYIGGFDQGSLNQVPEGAVESPTAPANALDKLINGVLVPYVPTLSLVDQLNEFFSSNLPEETQADLAPLKAAVKLELEQDRPNIAKLIIQRATIPSELEPLRESLLSLFPTP